MKEKVTINDVAAEAGVSKTTISRYLNGRYGNMSTATRANIAAVIERLNYRPNKQAQSLKSKRSYLIGVVVADISNMYSSLLLKGIGTILEQQGYQMLIVDAANSLEKEQKLIERMLDQSVEGIILQPASENKSHYKLLEDSKIPVVLVDRTIKNSMWPTVVTNNEASVKEVLSRGLKQDYAKVLFVTEPIKEVSTRKLRYDSVKKYTEAANKEFVLIEIYQVEDLMNKVKDILLKDQKILFFASNGRMLMELLTILIAEKIAIPESFGITGFDDWNLTALVGPGITSIEQQSQKIGEVAATQIMAIINQDETISFETIVETKIKWRSSI
ncbi:LacI family DNA-binding transcriptional regulator [Vagococcus sp.]|uniref:LacI family DNA-binding transcriptional regulator n=1 Tax=Vagococcus sp. TaxID=1933889 RepID=UPI003F9A3D69